MYILGDVPLDACRKENYKLKTREHEYTSRGEVAGQ